MSQDYMVMMLRGGERKERRKSSANFKEGAGESSGRKGEKVEDLRTPVLLISEPLWMFPQGEKLAALAL